MAPIVIGSNSFGIGIPRLPTYRARQIKAVLEHLKARDLIARDREHDSELGADYLARRLDSRCEITDDRRAVCASKDVLDLKLDGLCQYADIPKEVRGGLPTSFVPDPWKYTLVALDFEAKIFGEHDGESIRRFARGNAGEKLLCDGDIVEMTHDSSHT